METQSTPCQGQTHGHRNNDGNVDMTIDILYLKSACYVSNCKTEYVMVPENESSISFQGKVFVVWDHAPSIRSKIKFISA